MVQTPGANPFQFERPVQDPDLFFGRRDEVRGTLGFLRLSQCVSVVGPSKIGKTSLLNCVSHRSVLKEHGLQGFQWLFVYIDCRGLAHIDHAGCFNYIGTQIGRQVMQQHSVTVDPVRSFADLERVCEVLNRSGLGPVVIVLDAFESLVSNTRLDPHFFINLRSLNTNLEVAYLTASEKPLDELERKHLRMADTSPLSNIFYNIRLGSLDQDESRALLDHHFALAGLAFPDPGAGDSGLQPSRPGEKIAGLFRSGLDAFTAILRGFRQSPSPVSSPHSVVDLIIERTGGHPYLLQRAVRHAVNIWQGNFCEWDDTCREELLRHLRSLPEVSALDGRDEPTAEGGSP